MARSGHYIYTFTFDQPISNTPSNQHSVDKTFSRSYVSLSKLAVIPHWIVALAFKLRRQQFDDIARLGVTHTTEVGIFLAARFFV